MLPVAIASLLFGFATNMDNFSVAVSYGLRRYRMGWLGNVLIAALSGGSTFLAMGLGEWVQQYVPLIWAQRFGSGLLMVMGASALGGVLLDLNHPSKTIKPNLLPILDYAYDFTLYQSLLLGLALTLTNFATGVAAGLAQLPIASAVIASTVTSWVCIGSGFWLGQQLREQTPLRFGPYLEGLASLFLIAIGVLEWFESP